MPLTLAFAATIHRMQGLNVGKSLHYNDINENLRMILEPGARSFEMLCPGAAYTGFSRATSMGNGNPYESAIWLMGNNIILERFINMTKYMNDPTKTVVKIIKREKWVKRLEENVITFQYTKKEKNDYSNGQKQKKFLDHTINPA